MRNRVEIATNLCQIPEEVRDQHKGFSIWDDGYTSKHDHDTILKILIDGRNEEAVDVEGYQLPTLVYLAREKRPQYLHNFKAGAMNSLLRVSSEISNGPVILNVDCDMYSNNSESIRDALCFFMDEKKSQDIGFVQFPQNFENTTKNDIYGSTLQVISQVEFHGLDGLGGPLYIGTGCFHQREILCGRKYSKDYKIDRKTSNVDGTIDELEERAKSLASCVYELNSQWGKEDVEMYGVVKYENDLPTVDIFVCTADPLIEPPLMVINTVLSVMAYDYPPEKLSIYLSDDGGSILTFYALFEASQFSKNWLPYCKKYKVEPRSPASYFRSMLEPTNATHSSHFTSIKILIDGRDKTTIEVEGCQMPTLVYLAREKRPQFFHNFKAGAMNALLRVSSKISNGPVILNVDCDMYSNDSQSIRDALCFFMDEKMSQDIAFVQFPQRFENTTKNDIYGSALQTSYEVEFHGLDGFGGPLYIGTGCFHQREILCGRRYSKDYKIDWKNSNVVGTIDELEESAKSLASCTYELNSQWGKEMGLKYGCPIEDVITGLAIQCRGWKSVYMNPKRSAFLGLAATTLDDTLVQHKRWSEGELHIMLTHCPLWYEAELPKVDIFVCTADPVREPPIMVINTVLSVMAYDYPPEKLSIYLSDDGCSIITFYSLFEAFHFSKHWLPYCRKYNVEPRSPAAYFSSMHKPIDANHYHSSDFAFIKERFEEMQHRIVTSTKLGRIPGEVHDQHKGFSEWKSSYTSKDDHDTILQILIDGRDSKAKDVEGCILPSLVYLAREKRPQQFHNFKAGAMNALVESPGLDALGGTCYIGTGCFHQREILCGKKYSLDYKANWKMQDNNVAKEQENVEELEEKANVLASCTYEMNSQWGKEITSTWFLFFAYVIIAKYSYSLGEFISNGGTALGWWNEQRMWLYKRTSAYLLASIDTLLKLCGISNMKFVITSKVVDEDVSQRYEKEIMEFGVASPMFVILETLALMNLFTLIFTLKMGYGIINKLGLQILLCVVLVLVNLPLYKGILIRKDKGKVPTSVTIKSIFITLLVVLIIKF
uniref:Uncharacterized protein n=1 Tax=Chenopodium quinoa TaxID=63459 RepID=A0A803LQ94_CHEQI